MAETSNFAEARIGFLDAKRFENGSALRGAALVTDTETKPVEFRCTNPIRPTSLQKVLYGEILDQHVLVDIICVPLVRGISNKLSVLIVREPALLEIRAKVGIPTVSIMEQAESTTVGDNAELDDALLHSEAGKFEPLVLAVNSEFREDALIARPLLQLVGKRCSPLEPFERIQIALQQVHEQRRE